MTGSKARESQALLDAINRACDDSLSQEEVIQQQAMRIKQRRLVEREMVVKLA
jgi:hypothetical protein